MENTANVRIKTSSVGVMRELKEQFKDPKYRLKSPTTTEICIENKEGVTDDYLTELSKEFSETTITAYGSAHSSEHLVEFQINYKDGARILKEVKVLYHLQIEDVGAYDFLDPEGIENMHESLAQFFRKVDHIQVIHGERGEYEQNLNTDKIIEVTMPIGNHIVKARKEGSVILVLSVKEL